MLLTLTRKQPETTDVNSYFFTSTEPVTWKAGQYVVLSLPHENPDEEGIERYFTISSAPFEGELRITTRMTGTTFKKALNALPIGASIEMIKLKGSFTLEEPVGSYVFVAGGIGITPFRSILAQLDHDQTPLSVTLLYGNRSEDALFKQELEEFASHNPHLTIHYIISPEKIDAATVKNYIPHFQESFFYISGPEPMVEALEKTFADELGIPDERMKRDYFPGYDIHNF